MAGVTVYLRHDGNGLYEIDGETKGPGEIFVIPTKARSEQLLADPSLDLTVVEGKEAEKVLVESEEQAAAQDESTTEEPGGDADESGNSETEE
jgi:hypothetical protein